MDAANPHTSETVDKILENAISKNDLSGLKFGDSRLVAETLSLEGEMRLLKEDVSGALQLFDQALKLDPENSTLYCDQGLALFEYGTEPGREKALLKASRKFKMATCLTPDYFSAWHIWGVTLFFLGKTFKERHYFLEADEKLTKAVSLGAGAPAESLSDLYWDFGNVKKELALFSKEAMDWQLAIDAFQKAVSLQERLPAEFWNDYGHACLELSYCVNDIRQCVKAIHCFKHALSKAPSSNREGWQYLSEALQHLYKYTHDDDHFTQASECFAAAVQASPLDASLWYSWARFLCTSARKTKDTKKLKACIEKCQRAYVCDTDNASIIALWAEALALLGELTERLDLLYEAQNKIAQALDLSTEQSEVWLSQGLCLNSLGRYFADTDYHYQAIEKFQQGLSIDRTLDAHWHAIATSYTWIGEADSDPEVIEKALRFFIKALELEPNNSYYHFDYAFALSKLGELSHSQLRLEQSISQFEKALALQKNAIYLHPDWLFHYARTLDFLGDFYEEDSYYKRAAEILSHVLMIDPDFPSVHYQLALCFSHLGELTGEPDNYYRALHYYRLAAKHEEENDQTLLDLGLTLINIAQHTSDPAEADGCYRDAELKLTQAAKLGNAGAYYHLAGLFSLLHQYEKGMHFLEKADSFDALPSIEDIIQDEWLDSLRQTSEFREFLMQLEKRPNMQEGC